MALRTVRSILRQIGMNLQTFRRRGASLSTNSLFTTTLAGLSALHRITNQPHVAETKARVQGEDAK